MHAVEAHKITVAMIKLNTKTEGNLKFSGEYVLQNIYL